MQSHCSLYSLWFCSFMKKICTYSLYFKHVWYVLVGTGTDCLWFCFSMLAYTGRRTEAVLTVRKWYLNIKDFLYNKWDGQTECLTIRGEDPVLPKNRIRGSVPQTKGDFWNFIEWIFWIILKAFFFVFIRLVSDVPCKP